MMNSAERDFRNRKQNMPYCNNSSASQIIIITTVIPYCAHLFERFDLTLYSELQQYQELLDFLF
jgi:hypothetical protein